MDFLNDSRNQDFMCTIHLLYNAIKTIISKIYFSKSFYEKDRQYDSSPVPRPLRNIGLNCYLNSAFQSIAACPKFVNEMKTLEEFYPRAQNLFVFNKILAALSDNSHESLSLPSNEIMRNWNRDGEQDTFELLSHIVSQVFNELQKMVPQKITSDNNIGEFLPLHISMVFKLKCSSDHSSNQNIQTDLAIHLPIPFRLTTEELLMEKLMDNYFLEENITDSKCTDFLCSGQLSKFVTLKKPLPSTLCIHLQRSFWNSNIGCMEKNNEKVKFFEKLIIKGKYFSLTRDTKCTEGVFFQTFNGLFNKTKVNVNNSDHLLKHFTGKESGFNHENCKEILADGFQPCFGNPVGVHIGDFQNNLGFTDGYDNTGSELSIIKENGYEESIDLSMSVLPAVFVDVSSDLVESEETMANCEEKGLINKIDQKIEENVSLSVNGDGTTVLVDDVNSQIETELREKNVDNIDTFSKDIDEEYFLKSVIVHFGSAESGHYICHRKCGEKWFCTNDSFIREVSLREVLNSEAYILMYEKNE